MPKLLELFARYLRAGVELIDGDTGERIITRWNEPKSELVVGIDLGTCCLRHGISPKDAGDGPVTSLVEGEKSSAIVCFSGDRQTTGSVPDDVETDEKAIVIDSVKRALGHDLGDEALKSLANLTGGQAGRPVYKVEIQKTTHEYSPEQVASWFLGNVKDRVSATTKENVSDCVVSVPSFFANVNRQAVKDAAMIAGIDILRMISDPIAVALAYTADHRAEKVQYAVVVDLGAGFLDCALVKLDNGLCQAVNTAGRTFGGLDFDARVLSRLSAEIKERTGQAVEDSPGDLFKLVRAIRTAREELSEKPSAQILVNNLLGDFFTKTIKREEFERECDDLIQESLEPVKELFAESKVKKERVGKLLLVGGALKICKVRQIIIDYFGPKVEVVEMDENAAMQGAALEGAILRGNRSKKLEGLSIMVSTPLSVGISLANGGMNVIIPRGTVLPARKSIPATTCRDNQQNVGFDVVQGERPMAADNIRLGHVTVSGIECAKRGRAKLRVDMEINEDGMLVVTGEDLRTGAAMTVRITNEASLADDDVQRMVAEGEANRDEDLRRAAIAEARSSLVFLIERGDNVLKDQAKLDRWPKKDQNWFRKLMDYTKSWLEANPEEEAGDYQTKHHELRKAIRKIEAGPGPKEAA
jgi:molecular chaperone DnaK (HSP70)